MTVKVKICGITKEDDLNAAADAGADSLGFVVGVPSSPRNLCLDVARLLIEKVRGSVSCVAVTTFEHGDADLDKLAKIQRELNPDCLQLHSIHSSDLSLSSKDVLTIVPHVMGAIDAKSPEAAEMSLKFSVIFQSVLLDTNHLGFGGTGIVHDWILSRRIRNMIYPTPLVLAGGLNPENVQEAIHIVRPYGVDVSSGVEKRPGVKDHDKLFEFVRRAKRG